MTPRALLQGVAIAALAFFAGCSSTPVTRYYLLSATAPEGASPARERPPAVVLSAVALPQYLERSQLVARDGENRVRILDSDLWAGDLGQDMTRVLAENLGRLLRSDRVVAAPHDLRLKPDFRVAVEVLRFERGADGRVLLEARWWLSRASDGALLAGGLEKLPGAPLPAAATSEAVVASMSTVYGQLAQVIARRILAQGAGGT